MADKQIDPHDIKISNVNERRSDADISDLKDSIEQEGIIEGLEPVVRPSEDGDEDEYEAFIGQRRILAAREVGLDEIPVVVSERDDKSALKASIVENADLFKESVSSTDRAKALDKLWELMDGDGFPSATQLSDELNAPESTVRTWLEPLREEWEGTEVDPTTETVEENEDPTEEVEETVSVEDDVDEDGGQEVDVEDVEDEDEINDNLVEATQERDPDGPDAEFENVETAEDHGVSEADDSDAIDVPDIEEKMDEDDDDEPEEVEPEVEKVEEQESEDGESQINIVDELGEGKLQKIRTMTDGGEQGEEIAKRVAEEGLTSNEVDKIKKLHERGNDLDEAFEQVASETDGASDGLRTEVTLDSQTAAEVEELASDRGTTEEEIITEAVEYYLDDHVDETEEE